ncbi:hypothetical protein [Lacrimispora amygdalina]|uniref:hypothetical protein n=1 Tax=Lacrimispora amygdalina TaxID=253257 RepID=UPI000BE32120|nr:hypothetical protein [Lacrimispora amygdalina]
MVNEKDKSMYKLSKEDIIRELDNSEYRDSYHTYKTKLEQDECKWKYGKYNEFEQALVDGKLYYFAYIKFYLDNGKKYALVAGKTGSRNVNSRGSDVRFREHPYEGAAKDWLFENNKEWCQTEILVIKPKEEDEKGSEFEAREIERYLVNTFGLLES